MRTLSILIMFLLTPLLINAQDADTIVDPRDGQVYNIVRIGKQWWMAENLAATKYSDGTPLVDGTGAGDISGDSTTKYYFWYDDNAAYAPTYGTLYTWAAIMNGASSSDANPSGIQGVCPVGWHLPSDSEWKELEMYLGMSQASADSAGDRGTDEGGKLKETGTTYWYSPNTGATNSSGFTALPGGCRHSWGVFDAMGVYSYFWSSTENSYPWTRSLLNNTSTVSRISVGKDDGYSVRCLRNVRSDTLIIIPGDKQVTLKWDTIDWAILDKIYIYRDQVLIDIVDISSVADSIYIDNNLTNYREYSYFIRMEDIWGDMSITSDTITAMPNAPVTDYNGNTYNTVKIGKQVWMKENLKTIHYADGTPLENGTGAGDISGNYITKYWFVYEDDPLNKDTYGLLYTWAAAMKGATSGDDNPSGIQGVCPDDWHLPSDAEWKELEMYLGMSQAEADGIGYRGADEGGKLKESGTTHWNSPNTGATNSSRFTALPGGERRSSGNFYLIGNDTYFWSSREYNSITTWYKGLFYNYSEVYRSYHFKYYGWSVRCLRDFDYLPYLVISSDSVNFGSISKGIADTTRSVYLKNTHTDTLQIDSIYGADPYLTLDIPEAGGLTNIKIAPEDSVRLDITFHTIDASDEITDTIIIHINSYDTLLILTANLITFPDTLACIAGDEQITLKWDTTNWEYLDKVYIYRDFILIDSISVTSIADTTYTDHGLTNYRLYKYFICFRDNWGYLDSPTDTITIYPVDVTVEDYDGNIYNTVKIGDQIWLRENMKTTRYADGTVIPLVEGSTEWGALNYWDKAYCYYNNNASLKDIYGILYTWGAAMNGAASSEANPSGVQGVCPDGWHLPDDAEWKELELYLGMSLTETEQTGWNRGTVEGGKLKEAGTTHWVGPNTEATNSSGFTAMPAGDRSFGGTFGSIGYFATFWSSTENGTDEGFVRLLGYNTSQIYRDGSYKTGGFSVRCLRDFDYLSYLDISDYSINFGAIGRSVGDTVQSVYLKNTHYDTVVINSIYGADPYLTLDVPEAGGLNDISIAPEDSVRLDITLHTDNVAGELTDTIFIHIDNHDTTLIVTAKVVVFPDTLVGIEGDGQVNLKWDSTYWEFADRVYIYRDLVLIDSVMITSIAATSYTDHDLQNYRLYSYFIRLKDIWGNLNSPSDIVNIFPLMISEDYDGNSYNTIKIGDQLWMKENLKTTHHSDGTAIPLVEGASEWEALDNTDEAYCYYDNSTTNRDVYGALYTWAAAMNGSASSDENPSGVQGVCPDGWHLPSDAEWKELEMYLGMSQIEADSIEWRGTNEGGELKECGYDHWNSPNIGANNASGFTALPGGNRQGYLGGFFNLGTFSFFWSSMELSSDASWDRTLWYGYSKIYRKYYSKDDGFSVRCLRDYDYLYHLDYLSISKDILDFGIVDKTDIDSVQPLYISYPSGDSMVLVIDSITGADQPFGIYIPGYPDHQNIMINPEDSARIDITLSSENIAGIFTDTLWIFIEGKDTSVILQAEIPFFDTLTATPADQQITLSWGSQCWHYRDIVYIYRDNVLIDSVEVASPADTSYTDINLINYQNYSYFIRTKDIQGNLMSTTSDTVTVFPTEIIEDYDGNTYNTVKIGKQVWMRENIKSIHYDDGTLIPDGTGIGDIFGDITSKYWFAYVDNMANKETYGLLYTWAAAMNGALSSDENPSAVQGICPDGWHIPSDNEWKELEMYLGMSQVEADGTDWRGTDEGGKLKESGTTHWSTPNTGATNSSGFTAMPGAVRLDNGQFAGMGYDAYFWSSTKCINDYSSWCRSMNTYEQKDQRKDVFKFYGFSVRCLRDFDYLSYLTISDNTVDFGELACNGGDSTKFIYLKNTYVDSLVIDSIRWGYQEFTLDLPDYPGLDNISLPPGDSARLDITLSTNNVAGVLNDTLRIYSNGMDTKVILKAEIPFPDTLKAIPGDQQVILSWNSACWSYRDRVYIYRDMNLIDSVEITSPADTIYTDNGLVNYREYIYFIRTKDAWGNKSNPSDTISAIPCVIVTDFDGNEYRTVKIGDQVWMKENLKTTHYADGTPIPIVEDSISWYNLAFTEKAYCYFNNNILNGDVYGILYTWPAAMNGNPSSNSNPSGIRGICPTGWHLPSDSEWKELEKFLGMSQEEADRSGTFRGTDEGGKMKETGTTHWDSPNTGATNTSGFTALPGGYRGYYGLGSYTKFYYLGTFAMFWSSTINIEYVWYRTLYHTYSEVTREDIPPAYGLSVRCLSDEMIIPSPQNPQVNSCNSITTLTWNKVNTTGLAKYRIYRYITGQTIALYDSVMVAANPDTVFTDTATYSITYNYQITAVDSTGIESGLSEKVSIKPYAPVNLGSDREACWPEMISISAGAGFTGYEWSVPDSIGVSLTVATSGDYWVQATDSNGCVTSDTIHAYIWDLPVIDLGDDINRCEGESVILDAITDVPAYEWSVPDSTARTLTVTGPGTYWVKISNNHGCRNSDTVNVAFLPNPSPDLGANKEICPGDATILDAGAGYLTYQWSVEDSTGQTLTVNAAGTYFVEVTDNNGCKGSDNLEVSYHDLPAVEITGDTALCEGETATLDAGTGYQEYLWSVAPPNDTREINTGSAGKYVVSVKDSYGCTSSDSVEVVIHANPLPDLGPDKAACEGETVVLDAGVFSAYEWSLADSVSRTLHPVETSDYSVKVTDDNGCTGNDTIHVTIHTLPEPYLGEDRVICPGATVTLDAGAGFASYEWPSDGSTGRQLTVSDGGTYSVIVTDQNNCEGEDSINIVAVDIIPVEITGDTSICEGVSSDFDAGTHQVSYLWSTGDTTQMITLTEEDEYWVRGTESNGCVSYDTAYLHVYQNPASNLDDNINLCSGSMKTLDPGGNPDDAYLWSNDLTSLTIEIHEGGIYWVRITNDYGCSVTDTTVVVLRQLPDVNIAPTDTFITTTGTTELMAAGATSYNWWPAYHLNTTTGSSVTAGPDTNTTYYTAGSDDYGCSDTASLRILVYCNKPCGSNTPLMGHSGIINIGCTNNVYTNNDTCSWIIVPEDADTIYLYISSPDSFDIRPGDVLKVYNGVDRTGKLLFTFDNDRKPSGSGVPYPIIGGSSMYLELVTDASDPGTGFQAYYSDKPVTAKENIQEGGLRIYPNPFNNKTTIEFSNPQRERYQIILFNLMGEVIKHEYNIIEGRYELDRDGMPAGVYLLVIKGTKVYREKIVIE